MANPTTNYGFVLPTATDLVTDLPADFDVALQGVDTRLKALQPGTTLGDIAYSSATANTNTRLPIGTNGQVLGVSGGVPAWVTDASGMANPMTTTGDTIYSSSGSTPARLGIGSTGNVLTVSGGVPTWAAPATGGMTEISSGSLGTSTGITISSIPDTYKHLQLVLRGYYGASGSSGDLSLRFNGDTASTYMTAWTGFNGGAANYYYAGQSAMIFDIDQNAAQWNTSIVLNIYDYTSTSSNKVVQGVLSSYSNYNFSVIGRYYPSSQTAISSVTVFPSAGNVGAGSYILYGVK
jgi:hypothetical protein